MSRQFPESEDIVRSTLTRILEIKGLASEIEILTVASLAIQHTDHDNWNGGVDCYTLELRIPLEMLVNAEDDIQHHEKRILDAARLAWRELDSDIISAVRLVADRLSVSSGATTRLGQEQPPAFWQEGQFRLFLSHCNSCRVEVGGLKTALGTLGVCGFVAHDDIEPSQLWQSEIERALRTSEALVAVISDDFATSLWCDQEVGFALGRGIPVLPIQYPRPPHGFIGKVQGLPLRRGESLASRAGSLIHLLLRSPQAGTSMTNALVRACAGARSFADARATAAALESAPSIKDAHATLLQEAVRTNSQLNGAHGVPERLRGIMTRFGLDAQAI